MTSPTVRLIALTYSRSACLARAEKFAHDVDGGIVEAPRDVVGNEPDGRYTRAHLVSHRNQNEPALTGRPAYRQ